MVPLRAATVMVLCMALSGCYMSFYGQQSSGGGPTVTTTSSQVRGVATFSSGKVAFSSGQVPPAGAPGGHVSLDKGASAVLIVGLVLADLVDYIRGEARPKPLAPDVRIAHTCSCYQKPVNGE